MLELMSIKVVSFNIRDVSDMWNGYISLSKVRTKMEITIDIINTVVIIAMFFLADHGLKRLKSKKIRFYVSGSLMLYLIAMAIYYYLRNK